jgi:hypothetical protein
MSSSKEVQLGDIGTQFLVVIKDKKIVVDVSACTEKTLLFKKPSGSIVEKTATFTSNGADGSLQYISVEGDLDEVGPWEIQAHITFASMEWHTNTSTFKVLANLS